MILPTTREPSRPAPAPTRSPFTSPLSVNTLVLFLLLSVRINDTLLYCDFDYTDIDYKCPHFTFLQGQPLKCMHHLFLSVLKINFYDSMILWHRLSTKFLHFWSCCSDRNGSRRRVGRHLESCMVAGDWAGGGHTSPHHDAGAVLLLLCQRTFAMFHNHRNH